MPQSLIQSSQSGNGIFARLDGTNQPFTGNINIDNNEPTMSFTNEILGVNAVFRSTYFQVADDVPFSGLYGIYKATQFVLSDDGGTTGSKVSSTGSILTFYPDYLNDATNLSLRSETLEIGGTNPGFFISGGGGSSVLYYNQFQFANNGVSWSTMIADGSNYIGFRPTEDYDINYKFTISGLEQYGGDAGGWTISAKNITSGTNTSGGNLTVSGGDVHGNAVSKVIIKATGGGSSGTSLQSPNTVSTFNYNLINDVVNHYVTKSAPKYFLDETATSGLIASFEIDRLKLSDSVDFATVYYGDGSVARILPSLNISMNNGHEFTGTGGGAGALTYVGGISASTNGYGYTIQADSPVTGSNLNGGPLNLKSGKVRGNGTADIVIFVAGGNASGSTVYSPTETCRFAYNTTTIGPAGDIILGDSTLRTMYPQTTAKINLGNSANAFNDCYFGQITITEAKNIILGTTNGSKIGTSTSQKLAFYNSTPIVQPGATTDLGTVLSNLGLRASGTAYPITTSGAVNFTGGVTIATTNLTITDKDVALGTTTGTKFGTATTQKLSFYNATPIVQITTGVASSTRTGGGGTTLTDTDTFDGYTVAQIVKSLRNLGFLA